MEKYMPEQICPYCNHFYDCQCRSKAGSCHDWILDSGYEHLIGLIEIDDLVLSTDHPDCVPYKAAAERDKCIRLAEMDQFYVVRVQELVLHAVAPWLTYIPSQPGSIIKK